MTVMDVWWNFNMSVLVVVLLMLLVDYVIQISDEFPIYGMIGSGGIFFFAISGTLHFICSVIWGL